MSNIDNISNSIDELKSSTIDWMDNAKEAMTEIKGSIPAPQVQSDWEESDSSDVSYILHKPIIPEDAIDYLCFTAVQSNSTIRLDKVGSPSAVSLEYSTDKINWTAYTWSGNTGATITLATLYSRVWFRGDNATFSYYNNTKAYNFVMSGKIYASGNIMSLVDKTCSKLSTPSYAFGFLFKDCTSLYTPPRLPALSLTASYIYMFQNCTSLMYAPDLPAITVNGSAYAYMFAGCTSLTRMPKMASQVYFSGSMTHYGMFNGCTALQEVEFPYDSVPSTPSGNTNLQEMFKDCSSLKRVKVRFTDFNNTQLKNWLSGVSATGVFECPSALSATTRDASHIPAGWTVVRTDAPWSDWNQTDTTEASYIRNKPTIPDPQVQADWDESDSSNPSCILNKPVIPQPVPQVNADWDESDSGEASYILNKPTIPTVPTGLQKYEMSTTSESGSTLTVSPSGDSVVVATVASSLTLSASVVDSTMVAYAEVVLDVQAGATVTAGTNLTLVDTPEAGKRSVCVVRWEGGSASLYVTI